MRGSRRFRGVDDEAHVAVLDHVDDMGAALGHLVHFGDRHAVGLDHRGSAARGEQREAELEQVARYGYRGVLVTVAHADEGAPAARQLHARGELRLDEGLAERLAY